MSFLRGFAIAAAVALVGVGIIAGFLAAGSPQRARQVALDRERVRNLGEIERQLERSSRDATAPLRLETNIVGTREDGTSIAKDPVTGEPYGYQRLGPTRYRICATFSLPSIPQDMGAQCWQHFAGHRCFERSIVRTHPNQAPAYD